MEFRLRRRPRTRLGARVARSRRRARRAAERDTHAGASRFGKLVTADTGTPAPTADGTLFDQPLRWQGRWFSEQSGGIYDFRNRWWSPELGAFLSPDEFQYFDPLATLWSWPGQNPFRWRDPSGRDTLGRATAGALGAFLGADIGFTLGGGVGLAAGLAEGGLPAFGEAPAGALIGAGEGFLAGGSFGIAVYDAVQTGGPSLADALDSLLLAQRGKGNVKDTGIVLEAQEKISASGGTLSICDALEQLLEDAGRIPDKCERAAKQERIVATQKGFKCRNTQKRGG